jgi:hypothetical protein
MSHLIFALSVWLISQQHFSLTTNQPPATSQQYSSLGTNQHQPSVTNKPAPAISHSYDTLPNGFVSILYG